MPQPLALYVPICLLVLILWVSWPIARHCSCVINVLLDENCVPEQEGAVGVEGAFIKPSNIGSFLGSHLSCSPVCAEGQPHPRLAWTPSAPCDNTVISKN